MDGAVDMTAVVMAVLLAVEDGWIWWWERGMRLLMGARWTAI